MTSSILTDKISKILYQKSTFSVSATYPPPLGVTSTTKWLFYKKLDFLFSLFFLRGWGMEVPPESEDVSSLGAAVTGGSERSIYMFGN